MSEVRCMAMHPQSFDSKLARHYHSAWGGQMLLLSCCVLPGMLVDALINQRAVESYVQVFTLPVCILWGTVPMLAEILAKKAWRCRL